MNINNSKLAADTGKTNNDTNDVFGMDLYYNTSDGHLTSQQYYDGKLASSKWMATNSSGTKGNERAFVYTYDGTNRYTGETYSERATTVTSPFTKTHGWDENSIKYDVNGNIQALRRDSSVQGTLASGVLIDQLKYTYSTSIPDQLYTVYDTSGSAKGFIGGATGSHYTYDGNGNLTNEPYQGITGITYNVLNRTDSTKLTGTTYITYTYNAAGVLLRKKAYNSGTLTQTDYIGGFVYTGNGTTQTLAYAPMPEGRLLGTALTQEFVITDPQGNARVAFQNVSGVAKVTQENSYYGYGLLMPGSLVGWSAPPNKNLYNGGSEWQNDTKAINAGVPNYYQTYFRNYDPALARWVGVDPMAESEESMSVFQYAGDNPVMGNDPGGNLANVKTTQPSFQGGFSDPALINPSDDYMDQLLGGGGGGTEDDSSSSSSSTSDLDAGLGQNTDSGSNQTEFGSVSAETQSIATTIVNQDGTTTQINDGSNATFTYLGDGVFKFTGYTDQGGRNLIDISTLEFYLGVGVQLPDVNISASRKLTGQEFYDLLQSGSAPIKPVELSMPLIGEGGEVKAIGKGLTITAIGAYALYKAYTGYGDPNQWHTTYQPPSQNPINTPPEGFDPSKLPPGWSGATGLGIGILGTYLIYDNYNSNPNLNQLINLPVRDATYTAPINIQVIK